MNLRKRGREMTAQNFEIIDGTTPTNAETTPVSRPARWLGRILSGIVILFMLFDGAISWCPGRL